MTGPVGSAHVEIEADLGRFAQETKAKVEGSLSELNRIIDASLTRTSETAGRAGARTGASFTRGVRTGTRELASGVERQVSEVGTRSRGSAERAGASIGRSMGRSAEVNFGEYGRKAGERFAEQAKESAHHLSGAIFAGIGGVALGELVKGSLEAADQLEGADLKIESLFGRSAKSVEDWAGTMDTSFGLSKSAAESAAGTFDAVLRPLNLGAPAAARMSEGLVKLSANLAKARGADPASVQTALIAGLRGRATALRSLGIDISSTAVTQEAARLGLVKATVSTNQVRAAQDNLRVALQKQKAVDKSSKSTTLDRRLALDAVRKAQDGVTKAQLGTTGKMTDAAKTTAAYKLILAQTKGEQNAYADSSGRMKTQQEKITAQWTNMQAKIGTDLMPVLVQLGGYVERDLIPGLEHLGHWLGENKDWLGPLAAAVAGLWVAWKGYTMLSKVRTMWQDVSGLLVRRMGTTAAASTEAATTVERAQLRQGEAYQGAAEMAQRATVTVEASMAAQAEAVTASAAEQETMLARLGEQRAAMGAMPVGGAMMPIGRGAGAAEQGAARGGGFLRGKGGLIGMGAGLGATIIGSKMGGRGGAITSSAGTGAMIGSLGGPVGAGVGAAVGAAYGQIKHGDSFADPMTGKSYKSGFMDSPFAGLAKAKKDDAVMFKRIGDSFVSAQKEMGAASTASSVKIAGQSASMLGLVSRAKAAGLTQKDLTNAITGTNAQYQRTIAEWKAQGKPSDLTIAKMAKLHGEYVRAAAAAKAYANRTIDTGDAAKTFDDRVNALSLSVGKNGKTLDQDTSFGKKNASALRSAAQAAVEHAKGVYQQTGSLNKAKGALGTNISLLKNSAQAAGLNKRQTDALIASVLRMPKNRVTNISVNAAQARRDMQNLMDWLHSHTWKVHVGVEVDKLSGQTYRYVPGSGVIPVTAVGGTFDRPQVRMIGERGPEAVVPLNRPLSQVDPSVRALSAYAQGLPQPNDPASIREMQKIHNIWALAQHHHGPALSKAMSASLGGWGSIAKNLNPHVTWYDPRAPHHPMKPVSLHGWGGLAEQMFKHQGATAADPTVVALLKQISAKLEMLSAIGAIGPSVARELNGVTRQAALHGRTLPTGKRF